MHRSFATVLEDGKANALDSFASTCSGCSVWSMFSNGSRDSLTDICCCSSALASSSGGLQSKLSLPDEISYNIIFQHYLLLDVHLICLPNLFHQPWRSQRMISETLQHVQLVLVSSCHKRGGVWAWFQKVCVDIYCLAPPPLKSYLHPWYKSDRLILKLNCVVNIYQGEYTNIHVCSICKCSWHIWHPIPHQRGPEFSPNYMYKYDIEQERWNYIMLESTFWCQNSGWHCSCSVHRLSSIICKFALLEWCGNGWIKVTGDCSPTHGHSP